MPHEREFRTNKKVTESGASSLTQAASQSGQHNRWLAAATSGKYADASFARQPLDPTRIDVSLGRKTRRQRATAFLACFRPISQASQEKLELRRQRKLEKLLGEPVASSFAERIALLEQTVASLEQKVAMLEEKVLGIPPEAEVQQPSAADSNEKKNDDACPPVC